MKYLNSKRAFLIGGAVFLAGSLAGAAFRMFSPTNCSANLLTLAFSQSSMLNTPDEYRVSNHGQIIGIPREDYDKSIRWAHFTLAVQGTCFLLGFVPLFNLSKLPFVKYWGAGLLYVAGILVFAATELSSSP